MKLKSLLFGSAAILAAGSGAQAADLPVAEPVEYVRICDAFGTGYYYIPGTDTCLRVGGRVRAETHFENGDDFVTPLAFADPASVVIPPAVLDPVNAVFPTRYTDEEREFNNWSSTINAYIDLDARTQTDFGLIRTYIAIAGSVGNGDGFDRSYGGGISVDEAFIQIVRDWGTYTAGYTGSRFNYIGSGGINKNNIGVDANDPTVNQFAWTLSGGNGFSATLALEDPLSDNRRQDATVGFANLNGGFGAGGADAAVLGAFFGGAGGAAIAAFGAPFGSVPGFDNYEGQEAPDLVGNIRLDQGWGSVQVMGAVRHLHDEEFFESGFPVAVLGFVDEDGFPAADEDSDADDIGYAVGAGVTLNLPFFGLQFNGQGGYSEGAIDYVTSDPIQQDYFGDIRTGDFLGPDADSKTEAWNFHGNINGDITETVGFLVAGSYTEVDSDEVTFDLVAPGPGGATAVTFEGIDYTHWGAIAQLNWQPVAGLSWQLEGGYSEVEFDNNPAQLFALSNFTTTEDNFEMYRVSTRLERRF